MWFYTTDQKERHGPVPTEEVQQLLRAGALTENALVWTEGMPEWAPLRSRPEFEATATPRAPGQDPTDETEDAVDTATPPLTLQRPAAETPPAAVTTPEIALPPKLGGWMQFAGVMTILLGVLYALSCFGILWGVLLIIGGVALLGARSALATVRTVPWPLGPFFEKINTFFLTLGIFYIVMLVVISLVLIIYGGLLIAVLSNLSAM